MQYSDLYVGNYISKLFCQYLTTHNVLFLIWLLPRRINLADYSFTVVNNFSIIIHNFNNQKLLIEGTFTI